MLSPAPLAIRRSDIPQPVALKYVLELTCHRNASLREIHEEFCSVIEHNRQNCPPGKRTVTGWAATRARSFSAAATSVMWAALLCSGRSVRNLNKHGDRDRDQNTVSYIEKSPNHTYVNLLRTVRSTLCLRHTQIHWYSEFWNSQICTATL